MNFSSKHDATFLQNAVLLAVFLSAGVLYAWMLRNYHGQTGILPHYHQFIEFFANGLQRSTNPHPSFPLWGYGLVIWLFPDFFPRSLFQTLVHSVVLFALFVFFRRRIASRGLRILLLVLLLVPASFACAPPSQPYSLYADCIIVSLLALADSRIGLSAVAFGLALNFRSEAHLLPPAIAVVSILARTLDWKSAARWLVIIYACLIPWGAYTWYNEGVARITSSNAGAALIVGLGDLNNNKWGANGTDADPLIRSLLDQNGAAGISTLSSPADKILRAEFFRLVLSEPAEYLRKIIQQAKRVLWFETFPGRLSLTDECIAAGCDRDPAAQKALEQQSSYFHFLVHADRQSGNVAKVVTLIGYLSAPFLVLYGLFRRRRSIYLLNMWAVYSLTLFLTGNFISTYSANLFPVLAVNVALLASIVSDARRKPVVSGNEKIGLATTG